MIYCNFKFNIKTLLFLFNVLCFSEGSFLNIDEISTMTYSMDISGDPLVSSSTPPDGTVTVVSKYGQHYYCGLPAVKDLKDDSGYNLPYKDVPDIPNMLNVLAERPCMQFSKHWWKYELCYKKYVRQFHVDEKSGVITDEVFLGYFESDFDWSKVEEKSPSRVDRYHSQSYGNGTQCDLTGNSRQVEVRFKCREDAADHIVAVDEPGTCIYTILVSTPLLCSHPWLRNQDQTAVEAIKCAPVLSAEQYANYVLVKGREAAEKVRKVAQKHLNALFAIARARREESKKKYLKKRRSYRLREKRKMLLMQARKHKEEGSVSDNTVSYNEELRKILSSLMDKSSGQEEGGSQRLDFSDEQAVKKGLKKFSVRAKRLYDTFDKISERLSSLSQMARKKMDDVSTGSKPVEDKPEDEALTVMKEELEKLEKRDLRFAAKEADTLETRIAAQFKNIFDEAVQEAQPGEDPPENVYRESVKEMSNLLDKMMLEIKRKGAKSKTKNEDMEAEKLKIENKENIVLGNMDEPDTDSEEGGKRSVEDMLEDHVREKLTRAGVDTKGVRLRVITARNPRDVQRQVEAVRQLQEDGERQIFGVVFLGDNEDIQEANKQDKTEENYKFTWPSP